MNTDQGNIQTAHYNYTIADDFTSTAVATRTPDVRIDDADFEVKGLQVRAHLQDVASGGGTIAGTPLLRTPGTVVASQNTMVATGLVLARLNVNGAWLDSEAVPVDMLGAYAPGDDCFLANPFVIPARAVVYAEIINRTGEKISVFIRLVGRKVK